MSRTVIPVAAAVVKQGERFLLTQRLPGKQFANLWEFPGGKVEEGETLQQALERELAEELGVQSCAGDVLHICQNGQYMVIFLETKLLTEKLRCIEVQDASFVTVDEARGMDMAPQDRAAMEHMLRIGRLL